MSARPFTSSAAKPRPVDRAVPLFVRSSVFRRALLALPRHSRVRRELLAAAVRWGYGRFNETGKLPVPLFDPAVEFEQAAAIIDTAGMFSGIESFETMVSELREAFGEIRFEPESITQLPGDELLLMIRFRAMGGGSGIGADRQVAHLLTLRGGAVVRLKVFWEASQALETAAISE